MFLIALKSTLAKKLRLFSTALSVLLGVAFLSGTLVFTDTIRRTFDDLFADIFENTESYVRSTSVVELDFGEEQRGRMPEALVDTVLGVEGVADAQGMVSGFAQLVDADGDALGDPGHGAPTLGMSYVSGELGMWQLTEGSRAPGPGELVVDKASADKGDFVNGGTVTVLTQTGPHELTLVGSARFGSVDSPGGATIAIFDLPTAQQLLLGGVGEIDAIMVDAVEGIDEAALTERIAAVLPTDVEAITGTAVTNEAQDALREGMSFFNTFLLVFAVIGLIVACFTIFNTFQIIVTQRTKEMALMRSVGATRRQVLWAQLVEAVLVGVLASLAGLAAGVLVAGGLKSMMSGLGIDIPAGGTVFTLRTAVVAMVVGTVVTIFAAVFPSIRASKTPPLAAIRDIAIDRTGQSRRRLLSGGTVTLVGVAAFVVGLTGGTIEWVGLGAFLTFVGVFMLGPLIAGPVTKVIAAPLRKLSGITGELARENALRNPKRTARTGGALMIGVAVVIGITVIAANARAWIHDVYGEQFTGDYVVNSDTFGFGGLSTDLAVELDQLPEVAVATGIRYGAARDVDAGEDTRYVSIDPATAGPLLDLGIVDGTVESLTADGILLDDSEAADRALAVGDQLEFSFLSGVSRELTVQGIYTEEDLVGSFVVSHALHEQSGSDQFDAFVYLMTEPEISDVAARAAIEAASAPYANADVLSRSEYIDDQAAEVDQIVNLMYGLLALAVIIALFSIANSVALSIHERTRELGLLRAVGMTRRQVRIAVKWEAVLIGTLGTLLGLLVGATFGWAISVTLRGAGLGTFAMPIQSMVVVSLIAVAGALLASARPARRAAKLDVLRAIASE